MKLFSLIKAVLTEDMNLFKYKGKSNNTITKFLLPILLFTIVCFSLGSLIYDLALNLSKINLTYIMISLSLIITSFLTLIEGIGKTQSMLFDCRDNDILFSLPIKRSTILFVRIIKLLIFEYLFNLMFLLPTFIVYIIFENPGIRFYFLSILIFILIPIIPTIIACFIGYFIKLITSKMKSKNIIQTLLTSIFLLIIVYFSLNMETITTNIVNNASSINNIITNYYPVRLSINLIIKFNISDLIKLLLINIIPFILFILIGQKYYFKIISNSKNNIKKVNKNIKIRVRKPIIALTNKELKRYFKSPVLMFNTSFGLIIILIFTLILCFKGKLELINLLSNYGIDKNISTNLLYYTLMFFSLIMTSITSSSISLEGKTINITKSLPIDYKLIFKSKIIMCFIIELPLVLISSLLFILFFKVSIYYIIELILLIFLTILLNSIIGLIINLKYPKLNTNNDTEVVKQSMSSFISVIIGICLLIISIILFIILYDKINISIILIIHLLGLLFINIVLYKILMKKGPNKYQNLNV